MRPEPVLVICRTVDVALRRAIPGTNTDVKNMQRALEDIAFKLRIPQRKPWQQMTDDVIKATTIVNNDSKVRAFCSLVDLLVPKHTSGWLDLYHKNRASFNAFGSDECEFFGGLVMKEIVGGSS